MSAELQKQLVNTQAQLDLLRAEYSEFAYIVSHELAAPFRQIEGFANIIMTNHGDQFDDKTKRHFNHVIKGSETGSKIVQALLAYSYLCTQKLQVTNVDCTAIFDDVIAQLSALIGDTKAEYSCTELPNINGDSSLLSELFYQLIHNALHYHKPSIQPIISVTAVETEHCWEFCVKDNGIGIPDKQSDKVFKTLTRAVAEKNYSGSGMGLAIAKRIVLHHGGEIWFKENEGNGCSCCFTLTKNLNII